MEIRFFFSLWKDSREQSFGTGFMAFWFEFNQPVFIMTAGVFAWEVEVGKWEVDLMLFLSQKRKISLGSFDVKYTMILDKH